MSRKRPDAHRQSTTTMSEIPLVSGSQFADLKKRIKPLPNDANANGTTHVLYQLEEHIRHKCIRCNKIGITEGTVRKFGPVVTCCDML